MKWIDQIVHSCSVYLCTKKNTIKNHHNYGKNNFQAKKENKPKNLKPLINDTRIENLARRIISETTQSKQHQ